MKENEAEGKLEIHPWKWYGNKNSKVLIIGTFPPIKSKWSYDFFYPNKANFFWRVMAKIADTELQFFSGKEAVDERKKIMDTLNTAVSDMGCEILRKHNSSLDENLSIIRYMDIFELLDEMPLINKIIFTSSSGKVSAARWFNEYLKSKGIIHKFSSGKRPIRSSINYKGRNIGLAILFSTSPRAANRISFEELTTLYQQEISC